VQSQTLLVAGAESPGLFHALIRRLAELMPAAHTVEIPHASHMMHEDNPERFNAAVLRFLK
jgi:pimeloyl-ACP methyl ester carboxylesterase